MASQLRNLPDNNLSYFSEGNQNFNDYVEALSWAQDYAFYNRVEMMGLVTRAIKPFLAPFQATQEAINCHHNYVNKEHHFEC